MAVALTTVYTQRVSLLLLLWTGVAPAQETSDDPAAEIDAPLDPEAEAAAQAAAELDALADPEALVASTWDELLAYAPVTFVMEERYDPEAPWEGSTALTFTADGELFLGDEPINELELSGNVARWTGSDNPHSGSFVLLPRGPWADATAGLAVVGELASFDEDLIELRGVAERADEGILAGEDAWDAAPIVIAPEVLAELERRKLVILDTTDPEVPWIVQDGAGNPIDSFYFARMTGDLEAQELLAQEMKVARITGWSIAGGGVVLVGLASIPIALIDHSLDRPNRSTYEDRVDRAAFDSDAAYEEALEFQLGLYRQDLGAYRSAEAGNTDLRWTGVALAGGGMMAMVAAPYTVQGMVADRKDPSRTWSRDRAEQLMARYNAAVREELGIPEEWEDPWDE